MSLKWVTDLLLHDLPDTTNNTGTSAKIWKWKHNMKDTYITNLDIDAVRDFIHRI